MHAKRMFFLVIDCVLVKYIIRYDRKKEEIEQEGISSFPILVDD